MCPSGRGNRVKTKGLGFDFQHRSYAKMLGKLHIPHSLRIPSCNGYPVHRFKVGSISAGCIGTRLQKLMLVYFYVAILELPPTNCSIDIIGKLLIKRVITQCIDYSTILLTPLHFLLFRFPLCFEITQMVKYSTSWELLQ